MRLALAICLTAVVGSACAVPQAAGQTAPRGTVGGPPTDKRMIKSFLKGFHPTSPAIVIGAGRIPGTLIEIIAVDSRAGLCIVHWHASRRSAGAGGGCGGPPTVDSGLIEFGGSSGSWSRRKGWVYTDVNGDMSPTVASVRVTARLKGKRGRRELRVIYANPDAAILQALHQTQPFATFLAAARGCILNGTAYAEAFDSSGVLLGAASERRLPKRFDLCRNPIDF
jgi:hypothetical protein